jgi:hypothetical protein
MQPGRKPFDVNQAISTILFERSSRRFHELYPNLRILRHHRLAFFAYPLSGGFEHPSLGRIESIPCLAYSSEAAASATKVGS